MPTSSAGLVVDIAKVNVPQYFRCPISLELMRDPVIVSTGHTYDRSSIQKWISSGNTTCPLTMQHLLDFNFIPNHTLRRLIQEWCVANRAKGIERIPTPTQPADPSRVSALLAEAGAPLASAVTANSYNSTGSGFAQVFALRALRSLVKGNERNQTVLLERGAVPILIAVLFSDLTINDRNGSKPVSTDLAEEALATLVVLPLSNRERRAVMQPGRLEFLSRLLQSGSAHGKRNTVAFLESLADSEELPELRVAIAATDGIIQGIVHLISTHEAMKSSAAKIAMKCLFSLCLCRQGKERAVLAGAPSVLVERLVLMEKSDAERALGSIELLCTTEAGCSAVADHGLAVPALLSFILKVSIRATEYATGALLAICNHSEKVRRDALHAGIVKELLLLMQSDCSDRAKAKALNLLKLFRSLWFQNPSWMPDCGRTDVVAF